MNHYACVGHRPGTLYGCTSCEEACHCVDNFECLRCWDEDQYGSRNPNGSLVALLEASIMIVRNRERS